MAGRVVARGDQECRGGAVGRPWAISRLRPESSAMPRPRSESIRRRAVR